MSGLLPCETNRLLVGSKRVSIGRKKAISGTTSLWAMVFQKCEFITDQAFGCISRKRGLEIVILLVGGDKSSQAKDIQTAQEIARQLKE